ncbi:class I SAM-dependent methyltransferase [Paractinoplanes globisporus]|uniref:Class I SAM-dependent methyltransferase n=1 Tax=Paractinoplanes globisporus TaxID=113565 RepID=A0ABW6WQR6_9ACTN|nr:class I SAM-dependent methyltransferase [Actinoplanes globisporus]
MQQRQRPGYTGTGPGEFTPDGCAVDLYRRLPVRDEPQIIAAAVPPPATLLELGCGTGRVTGPLTRLGYEVTAVDESAAMLAAVDGARKVLSPIEDLTLKKVFDIVFLSSFLVHAPDVEVRRRMLRVCREHVEPDGTVIIQREGAGWHTKIPRQNPIADGYSRVTASEEVGDGVREVHVEYDFPDAHWTQTFRSRPLTVAQFETALREAGLFVERYLTPDGTWVAASPIN